MAERDKFTPVATQIPYDNEDSELISEDVKSAIDELDDKVRVSASPGYSWGRSGNLSTGTWLLNDGVSSNRSGRTTNLLNPKITSVSIANEDINTFDISFFEHDGDGINKVNIGTVSVSASRSLNSMVDIDLTQGKQLAVRITSGSAKNVVVGLQLSGKVI